MKKGLKVIYVLMITVIGLFLIPVFADSGWDSNYGSSSGGYSSGGYGSGGYGYSDDYWSSGSGYSSSNGGSSLKEDFSKLPENEQRLTLYGIGFFLFIVLLFNIISFYQKLARSKKKISHTDLVQKFFPDYTEESLLNKLYGKFLKVQDAWMSFDYLALKKLCSDELFNSYKVDLEFLQAKKEKNIMKNFTPDFSTIRDIREENGVIVIDMYLRTSFFDYVINEKTKEIVRGNKKEKVHNVYVLTFIVPTTKVNNICPNCGSKVEGDKCPYCHTFIKNISGDFILSTKQTL